MNNKNEIVEAKLMPAMSVDETLSAFKEYQSLRKKLEEKGDFISFGSGKEEKKAPTKQWRVKLSRYFGLCAEITKEWDTKEDNNSITYHKRARVIHLKSGLFYEATGACNTGEKERDGSKKYHNAESHAETRAKNRAILEFVGFGEVSAEELTGSEHDNQHNYNSDNGGSKPTNNDLATLPQINLIKTQIVGSHLFKPDTIKDKSILDLLESGMTKAKASEIISWWKGDSKKFIIGERLKRETIEKETKPAKKGKLEVKDDKAPYPVEDDEDYIPPDRMPE